MAEYTINPIQNTPLNSINDKILRLERQLAETRAQLAAERTQLEVAEGTPGVPRIVSKDPRKLSSWIGRWGGKTRRRLSKKPSRKNKRRHTRRGCPP